MHENPAIKLIKLALAEDIGSGDITTKTLIPNKTKAEAIIIAKDAGVLSGIDIAGQVFKTLDKRIKFISVLKNGAKLQKGSVIAKIRGKASSILSGERTAINFLQRLSGIATLSGKFADKVKGTKAVILDTRKTTPGMRSPEKAAVKAGGATNHRFGLYDAILIKDNHIKVLDNINKSISVATWHRHVAKTGIEIECQNLSDVKNAIKHGVKRILLDNMNISNLKKSVKMVKNSGKNIKTEASGGINLENVSKIAKTGVDYISVGAITHSAKAIDISLKIL